jgi:hypothetical protein
LVGKLSVGGYVIIDDFRMLPECIRAVEDYRLYGSPLGGLLETIALKPN